MFEECESDRIAAKLKILIQMSIVLIRSARRPVIRVGRFAGQYAKPRSSPTETRNGVELPSYFGDLVNRAPFTPNARTPDPQLLLAGYYHSAVTLNFIRSLLAGGFADLRRPEYFDLSHLELQSVTLDRMLTLVPLAGHLHVRGAKPGAIQVRWNDNETDLAALVAALRTAGYAGAYCV